MSLIQIPGDIRIELGIIMNGGSESETAAETEIMLR
jgi:hypothetical protein